VKRNIKNNDKISAVIVSYNEGLSLYENVCKHSMYLDSIIIVDNGSTDEASCEILHKIESDHTATVIRLNDNYGIGFALNRGVELALRLGKEWIITFDQDSTPVNDVTNIMIQFANQQLLSRVNVSIMTPRIITGANDLIAGSSRDSEIVQYAITSGNLIRAQVFKAIGLYNEDYFIDSVDFEFCLRAKQYGYRIHRVDEALLLHRLGSRETIKIAGFSVDLVVHSPLRRYYIFRNHFWLMATYWNVSPVLIIKKTTSLLVMLLQILFFEKNKYGQLKMIRQGLADCVKNKRGRIDVIPSVKANIK